MVSVRVECYAGYRGEQTPRRFSVDDRRVEVREVLDRWLDPDHRYFKVRGDDDAVYLLRENMDTLDWTITRLAAAPGKT